ncbi:hypothetical protein [Polluticaenibacter yanchengensis]|uniref:MarR family transcriptional regulator n=1 Tax=Polluticaenibacter yanchengensis TaxID=3014562 RepID=A0ABT4UIS8_9BACT|nr:hypothetical protein [Chitinophagaceae bacterium LY-5]
MESLIIWELINKKLDLVGNLLGVNLTRHDLIVLFYVNDGCRTTTDLNERLRELDYSSLTIAITKMISSKYIVRKKSNLTITDPGKILLSDFNAAILNIATGKISL